MPFLDPESQIAKLFFKKSPVLGAGWEEKALRTIGQKCQKYNLNQRSGLQTKILKIEDKNQTQSRIKDLQEEDSEAESRPEPNHILAVTKINHKHPASSVTMLLLMLCI